MTNVVQVHIPDSAGARICKLERVKSLCYWILAVVGIEKTWACAGAGVAAQIWTQGHFVVKHKTADPLNETDLKPWWTVSLMNQSPGLFPLGAPTNDTIIHIKY